MSPRRNKSRCALLSFLLLLTLACSLFSAGEPVSDTTQAVDVNKPVDAFTATVTSPVSVMVKWPATSGATKYLLEVKYGDLDFFPLAEVAGDQTSYEDFPAPDDMDLTYRLQAVTASGTNDAGTIGVTTPKQEPNPLTVQAHDYEPVPWTPPVIDPLDPNFDPNALYPPGFDPSNPDEFDPSSVMTIPSVTEIIGPEGGTISMTSPDDVRFNLQIPAGVLDAEIPITLTPIESIDGLPLSGGMLGAVRIDPEGLQLELPFLLSIELAGNHTLPAGTEMYGFAFAENGQEFHLQPFAPEGFTIQSAIGSAHLANVTARPRMAGPLAQIAARQLQPQGVGAGTKADARSVVQDHRPTSNQDAAANKSAVSQADDDLSPLVATPSMKNANTIAQSVQDAKTLQEVMKALDNFETHIQQYGDKKGNKELNDKIWDQLLDKLYELLMESKGRCITSADLNAVAFAQRMLNPPKGSFSEKVAKRFIDNYGDGILENIKNLAKNCQYKLDIGSSIQTVFEQDGEEIAFTIGVDGEIPLKWMSLDGEPYLAGRGNLTYAPTRVEQPNANCEPLDYDHPNKAYAVIAINVLFTDGKLSNYDMTQLVVVDAPGAKFEAICYDESGNEIGRAILPMIKSASAWLSIFTTAHRDLKAIDKWKVFDTRYAGKSEEKAAEKVYEQHLVSQPNTEAWKELIEITTFTLLVNRVL